MDKKNSLNWADQILRKEVKVSESFSNICCQSVSRMLFLEIFFSGYGRMDRGKVSYARG